MSAVGVLLLSAGVLSLQPTLGGVLSAAERLAFSADREREGLLRRVRQRALGGDPLSELMPASYALADGSCIAITGASDGIGREAAAFLAQRGFSIVLCARDQAKGEAAMRYVRALSDATTSKLSLAVFDQSSAASTARGADRIIQAAEELGAPLRGLLLNAGVWPTERRITADGLEEGMQVCHVANQQLTARLLPHLCAPGEEARVVTVASSAHSFVDGIALGDQAWETRSWDSTVAYGESKLANVLFARELAHRLPLTADQRLTSLCVHPGVVSTSLFREFGSGGLGASLGAGLTSRDSPLNPILKSPTDGCRTSVYALLAPRLPNGAYLSDCEVTDVSPAAKDTAAQQALWEWTDSWIERATASSE